MVLPIARLSAQVQPPSDKLLIDGTLARTWNDGTSDVVQISGPLTIHLDRMDLTAHDAVIWLSPDNGPVIPQQRAEIALIGDAVVQEPARGITRSGTTLFVTVSIRGDVRFSGIQRLTGEQTGTAVFTQAAALRASASPQALAATAPLRPV